MAKFMIRRSTSADEAAVSELLELSYSQFLQNHYEPTIFAKVLPIISRANPSLLTSGTYYLAEARDGSIIGAGGWTKQAPGSGDRLAGVGHVRHFATHPSWTGQGVGGAILNRCVEEARSSGVTRLQCFSGLNAVDFYAKLGFKAINPVDLPFGSDPETGNELSLKAMLMERQL
jgi:GNAT superfamily N-acetyltransferase